MDDVQRVDAEALTPEEWTKYFWDLMPVVPRGALLAPPAAESPPGSPGAAERVQPPPEPATRTEEQHDILTFTGAMLRRAGPAIGKPRRVTWEQLALLLQGSREVAHGPGRPWAGPNDAKAVYGGWVAGAWRGDHRASGSLLQTRLMTLDIDGGSVWAVRGRLKNYSALIHSTYKHTLSAPRCRAVLLLAKPCTDPADYKRAHAIIRGHLKAAGLTVDDSASDASRLNYYPLHQPGVTPEFVRTHGAPVDIDRVLGACPRPVGRLAPTWTGELAPGHYRAACLRNAYKAMATATPNSRHMTLYKTAAGLARPDLGISEDEIMDLLFPLFVRQAGPGRAAEGERTIRNAVEAGRRGTP